MERSLFFSAIKNEDGGTHVNNTKILNKIKQKLKKIPTITREI